MMTLRTTGLLLALALVAGCETTSYLDVAQAFVGGPSDRLLADPAWGPPHRRATLSDGREVWHYEKSGSYTVTLPRTSRVVVGNTTAYGTTDVAETRAWSCGVSFIVDGGWVREARSAGDGPCR